jgi:SAM-dependent methyltransferase
MPATPIRAGRLRLGYRWTRFFLWSLSKGHPSGMSSALKSLALLGILAVRDLFTRNGGVECNICGWKGAQFYPNAGSGYFELNTNCPRCLCIHRYRSLAAILDAATDCFSPENAVIEVAPVRSFQAYCLWRKQNKNYLSFDLEKFGMEKGDITAMHYAAESCDYFLCFHVLEHVPDDSAAIREIFRVLRPGGQAVLQVPVDYSLDETVEYGRPNPLETGHVRRYSQAGFLGRLTAQGFDVCAPSVGDYFSEDEINHYGFNVEKIYIATKPMPGHRQAPSKD